MFTILGADGKEYGPVAAAKISEWIAGGRANLQTKARRVDETEWRTLADYPEFNGSAAVTTAGEPPAVVAPSTPVIAPLQGTAAEISARLAGQASSFDLFSCLSRSFELWKANFLPLVGVTVLALVVQFVANMIPVLGFLSSVLLTGVFTGGIYYYYLGKMRGEPREVGDVFAGFTKGFVPLMLAGLIMNLLMFALIAVFFTPLFLALVQAGMGASPENFQMPALSGFALGWMMVGFIPLVYFAVSWIFAYALVIDQGLGPWTALEVSRRVITRRWFSMFFLLILAGILAMLGIIGLFIGIIFTIPLAYGAILYAYEDLCRPVA